jgi:hypothetical protein
LKSNGCDRLRRGNGKHQRVQIRSPPSTGREPTIGIWAVGMKAQIAGHNRHLQLAAGDRSRTQSCVNGVDCGSTKTGVVLCADSIARPPVLTMCSDLTVEARLHPQCPGVCLQPVRPRDVACAVLGRRAAVRTVRAAESIRWTAEAIGQPADQRWKKPFHSKMGDVVPQRGALIVASRMPVAPPWNGWLRMPVLAGRHYPDWSGVIPGTGKRVSLRTEMT